MRLAIVSDIHGNLTALEAVVADLRRTSPDLVVQGGDVAALGTRPAEVADRVRELGWPSVVGNSDELLWDPTVRAEQERRAPRLIAWLNVLFGLMGPWAAERLGDERVAWLREQPGQWRDATTLLVHAAPGDLWRAPMPDAPDGELVATYDCEGVALAIYGHIHRPFVRTLPGLTVANSGSVGLSFDGDPRAAYLLIDDGVPSVRRVEYDIERTVRDARDAEFPMPNWLAGVLRTGQFSRP
jgi:predicted phosphodiesterase